MVVVWIVELDYDWWEKHSFSLIKSGKQVCTEWLVRFKIYNICFVRL